MRSKTIILLFSVLITTITACKQDPNRPSTTPMANSNGESYEPGENWTLVWADEFDGNALNEDNWNRQVVEPGRFNEEWQRYTDSEANSYVENGQLVIKAIHVGDEHGMDQYRSKAGNTERLRRVSNCPMVRVCGLRFGCLA